jgi:hypothetical protein
MGGMNAAMEYFINNDLRVSQADYKRIQQIHKRLCAAAKPAAKRRSRRRR